MVMFKGGRMNPFSVSNSSIVTDTQQVSSFCLEGCAPLTFGRKTCGAMTPSSAVHQAILATEHRCWLSVGSLLLLSLQLEQLRTFPGPGETVPIQEKPKPELWPQHATYHLYCPTGSLNTSEIMAY